MNPTISWLTLGAAAFGVSADMGTPRNFDIPAQPLATALSAVARQSDLQLLFADDNLKGKRSPALKGAYTPEQAIDKLLSGANLNYAVTATNTISIKPSTSGLGTTALPKVTVTGRALSADDPYNPDYNRTNTTTATKTDTPIMDTPVSIQVVPQQVLKDRQVVRIEQALKNVSGVFTNNSIGLASADDYTIRGFRTNGILYRDGFRFGTSQLGKRDPANIERIEVLKGPASVLFGRIEPGGLINLVTKQPQRTPYYGFSQQFGSFDFFRTTLDATGPLSADKSVAYRLNLAYETSGSFREFVSGQRYFVAPVLQWNITPDSQLTISLDHTQLWDRPDVVGQIVLGQRPAPLPRSRNLGESFAHLSSTQDVVTETFTHKINEAWQVRQRFNTFQGEGESNVVYGDIFPGTDVTNGNTLGRTLGGIDKNELSAYSASTDLIGKFDTWNLSHTLLIGGDWYYEDTVETGQGGSYTTLSDGTTPCQTIPSINIFNPVHSGTPATNDPRCLQTSFPDRTNWYGLYLQDQIQLPYEVFLLGGLRYDNATEDTGGANGTFSEDRVSPRGGLLWRPLDWFSVYASYVENFGASNQGFTSTRTPLPPQTAQQWETGLKTELWDGRLTGSFAYYDLTKQNLSETDPRNQNFSIPIGEAQSHGVELDLAGEIVPGWRIIANYAYTEARVTQGNELSFPPVGSQLPNVPKHAGSVWNTYEFENGDLQGLTIGGGAVIRSQWQGNATNDYQVPGYVTVDVMASYRLRIQKANVTLVLNAENLLDKNYIAASADFTRNRLAIGTPRSFMGQIRVEF